VAVGTPTSSRLRQIALSVRHPEDTLYTGPRPHDRLTQCNGIVRRTSDTAVLDT